MNTNLQLSFDFTKFERRKTKAEKDFKEENLSLLVMFRELVLQSHEQLHKSIFKMFLPTDMDKNMPAVSMNSFIRQGLIRLFPMYCFKATKKRFKLITDSRACLFIKKLNKKLRPNNIDTNANKLIINQRTDDSADKDPIIFLGYTTPPDFSVITGIYAVCINGKETAWRIDLADLGNSAALLTSIKPKGTGPKLKDGIVKVKKQKKE